MNYKNKKIEIVYPSDLIDNMENIPSKHVCPCSVLLDNKEIGGIFISCPSQDIEYFQILPSSPPQPHIKYRMFDFEKQIFVIEIWMQFNQNPERFLKMHLNPHDPKVKKLLKLAAKSKMISFLFYNPDTEQLSTAITGINDDETDWFVRNYKLSAKLKSAQKYYLILAEKVSEKILNPDRIYNYFPHKKPGFFIKDGGEQVMLQDVS